MATPPVAMPWEFHGQRSLTGYSPLGHKELDMTEWLTLHFHPPMCRYVLYVAVQWLRCVQLWPHGLQLARLPCPKLSPRVCSNSWLLSRWCHPTISSSVIPFSFCPQSFPPSGSFLMSQFFASGGQSFGVSASASVIPIHIHGWFTLGLTGLISLLSKGLSRVFFNMTVQKHQFFGAQLSSPSKSHIHTWLLEKP